MINKYNKTASLTASITAVLFFLFVNPLNAQNGVRIAATTGTADASAMLDVVSSTKGFLVPRLSLTGPALTNPAPVTSPADGLLIYNLGLSGIAAKGLYFWDATTSAWRQLASGTLSGGGTSPLVAKWTSPTAIGNSQITDNATNVGINSATPAQKLDVQGGTVRISGLATASGNRPVFSNTSGDLVNLSTVQLIDPLYIRGTGLNNNANRVLRIGTNEVYNLAGGRGLRLTIITKATHAIVSTTDYDTYGSTVSSDALATALNALTNAQIGVLTSNDAWEGNITTNLQNAFKRLGLYKALGTTVGGSRRPYAAIFEGATGSSIPTASAAEVEHSADGTTAYAEIRGWLIDGSFVATTQVPSGLATPVGSFAAGVDESGNVKVTSLAGSGLRPVFSTSNGTLSTGLTPATIYSYTGADQTYTVPAGVTSLTIKLWGGGGGGGYYGGWGAGFSGGAGGYTQGVLTVTPSQVLTVIVGAGGLGGNTANNSNNYGGGSRSCNGGSDCRYGGQGGGRSAIRNGGTELMTAGGGGGGGSSRNGSLANYGGAGGGIEGQAGTSDQYNYAHGLGGNQSAGGAGACCQTNNGSAGSQFTGGQNAAQAYGGSGGGGWYGGGGGGYQESNTMGGGGGGSGYIGGAGVSNAFTIKGDLSEPPKVDDIHYLQGIARGGLTVVTSVPLQGGAGRVVIIPNP